ncbi:ATP-binding cassette domain-containing protein [Natronorubrum sp. JWXQ-INN-674]|uniref:ATP-binding cassette domain-containing protein n=1 Tax=Natronorubrum halalkaliphilum TaxID=2691917 RepID=A0A6B0VQ33_9EURY|nr:ABC transporter ATP-binding protein [Natronorubrum halalkaliphilum]MXV63197.1 ATP-binding cassette domain-containing protein [Natronorubrum halalkaliphilum]
MTAIETTDLTKRYGEETALESLELTVDDGEVFGFLGPNGAGKTTTIDLLLDFIRPTAGSATVLGYDTHDETDAVRDRVGILPDGFDLWERSSGYRHLEFALESKNGTESPEALLERVGLDLKDAERPVGDYSKGMAQRLAMAMALVGDPDLLILDEPSSGLDPHGIRTFQEIIREEAADGTTVFFSSHILGQVAAVCDRVGILDDGELVTVDTIAGLRERSGVGSSLVVDVAGEPSTEGTALTEIDGVTEVTADDGRLRVTYADPAAKALAIHRLVESGPPIVDFETEEATLEDLFSAFTGVDGESVREQGAVADEPKASQKTVADGGVSADTDADEEEEEVVR